MSINDDFDARIERDLQQAVGNLSGPSARVGEAAYHAAHRSDSAGGPFSKLAAMTSHKAAAGLALAMLAIGGGSVAAAAATGSASPAVWGSTVTAAVTQCKTEISSAHGIGGCVSKVAREKGAEERAAHARTAGGRTKAHPPANAHANAGGQPDSSDNSGHPSHPSLTPHPDATSHSGGQPASHPSAGSHSAGKPSGPPSH